MKILCVFNGYWHYDRLATGRRSQIVGDASNELLNTHTHAILLDSQCMVDALEVVENVRLSIKKWHITVRFIVYL